MPFIRVTTADARKIRPRSLRAELERVVVHGLAGQGIMAVSLHLRLQRAHHLRVAQITTLAYVDVAAGEFQRTVRLDSR